MTHLLLIGLGSLNLLLWYFQFLMLRATKENTEDAMARLDEWYKLLEVIATKVDR